jgi:FkbM family methyltransferase
MTDVLLLLLIVLLAAAVWLVFRRVRYVHRIVADVARRQRVLEDFHRSTSQEFVRMRAREILRDRPAPALPVVCRSQYGEEGAIWSLLDYKRDGYYIEVGAYDGVNFSGSYFFESIGWTGLLIEADPALFAQCRQARPGSRVVNAAVGPAGSHGTVSFSKVEGGNGLDAFSYLDASESHRQRVLNEGGQVVRTEVPYSTLDDLLAAAPPASVDFLILDVEGMEADVLRGLDFGKWRPSAVMVERNDVDADGDYAAARLLRDQGYVLARSSPANDVFVRRALATPPLV